MATRIMYLMDYYINPRGGTEGQVLQLIQFMDRSRYEPTITLLRNSEYIERNGFACQVRVLGITTLASIRSIVKVLRFGLTLRRQNYRLVHCFFNDTSMIAPPILRMLGIRVLVSRRDLGFWHTPWNLAVLRLVAPFVDRYVANSQAVKRIVRDRERVADERISVIYNCQVPIPERRGGEAGVVERLGPPDDNPIIGIVANLRPIKRIDTLVEALAVIAARFPSARLVIVGDHLTPQSGQTFELLKNLAGRLGVRDRVIFAGSVDDPMPYISRFSVAVLCSESEGFSNSIIEYMQAARPIVCTDTGGNSELVQDGINGFLVPVGDVRALADRILLLLSDSALANRLAKAARETVLSSYSHTRMVSEHMTCYDEVLAVSQSALKPQAGI